MSRNVGTANKFNKSEARPPTVDPRRWKIRNPKQYQMTKIQMTETPCLGHWRIWILNLFRISIFEFRVF